MAAKPLVLRLKTRNGQQMLESLTEENSVEDLKAVIFSVTSINPMKMRVLRGYPPKTIDLNNDRLKLSSLQLNPKETLIIEEVLDTCDNRKRRLTPNYLLENMSYSSNKHIPAGILMRRPVPANNSCLFTSIYFAISGGELNENVGAEMRQIIADTVAADRETYNEGFLGKPNREYCTWILNEEHWGGAIEVSILTKYYSIEIVVVDTQNVRLNHFGEDMNYQNRILLIYDGIHYDPLVLELFDENHAIQTVFPSSDANILEMALEVCHEARATRQYTDVQNFTLRCIICNIRLVGQQQAQEHAKETGHQNFTEI
ncbi:ubiquitin thioesterase OTU1-like protein [Leptotrombidium deliense]|uniref:Ubiquitin thioesterase OTU n=1 Tax=Leptotrombidium deliense TaxID=299467 RepID=A0A443SQS3_9ACAR|nr:ubiquitin thioesterase OTU1-like protein [Leptotrombidium deliense]